jgi:hypothetical protein
VRTKTDINVFINIDRDDCRFCMGHEDKQTNIRFVALNNNGLYSTCQQNNTFLFTLRILGNYPPLSDVNTAAI